MRVIAGSARRTSLVAPAGESTRPTSDRAKEGLFNIIAQDVRGARFLDIFCGSGAIGIEALSRGAKEAVFVENAAAALVAAKANLAKTKFENARLIETSADKAIEILAAEGQQFDIIFLDPPYRSDFLEHTLQKISNTRILGESSTIVAETESVHKIEIPGLNLTSTRAYGRTIFLFYKLARG